MGQVEDNIEGHGIISIDIFFRWSINGLFLVLFDVISPHSTKVNRAVDR